MGLIWYRDPEKLSRIQILVSKCTGSRISNTTNESRKLGLFSRSKLLVKKN
jgi:hypothetical protein